MIQILLFAGLQEKVGKSKLVIDEQEITMDQLKTKYLAHYGINEMFDGAMVAVNEEYADKETTVRAGDIVAFIPPVSGG